MSKKSIQTRNKKSPAAEEKGEVLAIDPGFGRLGYAVLTNGHTQRIVRAGCIETPANHEYRDRLAGIGKRLTNLIDAHQPESMALEKIFFAKNQKTAIKIAEVRGLILYLAITKGLKVFEFTPLEVKTAVCSYGRADKTQISTMVKSILKTDSLPESDDAIDAIAIGLTYFANKSRLDKHGF